MRILPRFRRGTWLLAGTVWAAACAGLWWALIESAQPRKWSEADSGEAFRIDPAQQFSIEFGRGSGWRGLETFRIDQNGLCVIVRRSNRVPDGWETASLTLPPNVLAHLVSAVEENGLLRLDRAYHADIHDGTQWVLLVTQVNHRKRVYFNNNFPREIKTFAAQLEEIMRAARVEDLAWSDVPMAEARNHERELWRSDDRK